MHISLGRKKQREEHIKYFEDALTSAFFGTLCYLPPCFVINLFISIMGSEPSSIRKALAKLELEDVSVQMEFWPNLAVSGRVEPDLLVSIIHPSGTRMDLLIECKWKSGASSDFQLWDQWQALEPAKRSNSYHVYLVRDLQHGYVDREINLAKASEMDDIQKQAWDERLIVISWFDILKALSTLSNIAPNLHYKKVILQWQKDMAAMFERIGVREFGGFKHLVGKIEAEEEIVFWNPFRGFHQLANFKIDNNKEVVFLLSKSAD